VSGRLLVVTDDAPVGEALATEARACGWTVERVGSGAEALAKMRERPVDIVLTDLALPDGSGLELLASPHRCRRTIVITDSPVTGVGRVVRRAGAYACCRKPLDASVLATLLGGGAGASPDPDGDCGHGGVPGMVGRSAPMRRLREIVQRVGNSHATVLVEGESGTGKELVARAVHALSPRANGPFVAVNCAALSAGLLESELFGHEQGAFTGAHRARRGRFELADRGTLLLDEVGEMATALQAKLLRALEEMEVVRVGGDEPIPVDVRVVAATNRPLRDRVSEGSFREDLFYRLNVVRIGVPPLREREGDVPLLVGTILDELAAMHGLERPEIDEAALSRIAGARWPGNVRELRNFVERMLLTAPGSPIGVDHLPRDLEAADEAGAPVLSMRPIAEVEKELIRNTLRDLDGNREQAARVLGISTRTLYRRIKELGLT
jgi:DNA-binding NtrC family response regulator